MESSSEEDDDSGVETPHLKLPKLSVVFRHMTEDINSLYQMSLLLSHPGFTRRYLHSTGENEYDPRVASYANYDLRHIEEKLREWNLPRKQIDRNVAPKILEQRAAEDNMFSKEHKIIAQRLARANTKRREQLLYWSLHPDRPSAVVCLSEDTDTPPNAAIPLDSADAESRAPRSTMTKESFSTVAASDLCGTQSTAGPARTIYVESIAGNKRSNRVPNIPVDAKESSSFDCPYCHTTLESAKMQTRNEWKYAL